MKTRKNRHAFHGTRDQFEELLWSVGPAGEARLVQLQELHADALQRPQLGVDDWKQCLGDGPAVAVDLAAVDAAGQRVRPRYRHLDGSVGEGMEATVLLDDSQAVRRR